jgi:hypothetical protein
LQALAARLRDEERLVRDSVAAAEELFSGLRRGDAAAVEAGRARHEDLANRLTAAAAERARIVRDLGAPATISELIALLPEPEASELRAVQTSLAAAATELAGLQRRNANLVQHLRSYFRGVLTALTAPDGPVRYSPSGARLAPGGGAIQARG